jgi:hypothetical protein
MGTEQDSLDIFKFRQDAATKGVKWWMSTVPIISENLDKVMSKVMSKDPAKQIRLTRDGLKCILAMCSPVSISVIKHPNLLVYNDQTFVVQLRRLTGVAVPLGREMFSAAGARLAITWINCDGDNTHSSMERCDVVAGLMSGMEKNMKAFRAWRSNSRASINPPCLSVFWNVKLLDTLCRSSNFQNYKSTSEDRRGQRGPMFYAVRDAMEALYYPDDNNSLSWLSGNFNQNEYNQNLYYQYLQSVEKLARETKKQKTRYTKRSDIGTGSIMQSRLDEADARLAEQDKEIVALGLANETMSSSTASQQPSKTIELRADAREFQFSNNLPAADYLRTGQYTNQKHR